MANQKDSENPKDHYQPDSDGKRPKHKPEGREHQVHKEIIERRMRGGPEPTPEAYTHALEQWKKLPGSIVRPPTDISFPPPDTEGHCEPADEEGSNSSKPEADDQNKERQT